ncbi:MAG: bifunctional DNA-formamidopyrimidine glycosylase/DNA-(apurinic or apyrimidinic site) lyase [Alphaproteobacteria bacterium]
MPELPEVETVRCGIERLIRGKSIDRADVRCFNLRKKIPKNFDFFLRKKIIKALVRRGKYIIFEFKNDHTQVAVLHLGMSGRVNVLSCGDVASYVPEKHDHVFVYMEDGSCLVYNDPRRFGMFYTIDVPDCPGGWGNIPPFDVMGAEPLDVAWNGSALFGKLKRKSGAIKAALLDQKVVAGLGNIYVCEALYQSGVNPLTKANNLDAAKCEHISVAVKDVLLKAIDAGGSSLRDYRAVDGSLGYFQHRFHVYGRAGHPCKTKRCEGTIRRIMQGGRSTFYCPACQTG